MYERFGNKYRLLEFEKQKCNTKYFCSVGLQILILIAAGLQIQQNKVTFCC